MESMGVGEIEEVEGARGRGRGDINAEGGFIQHVIHDRVYLLPATVGPSSVGDVGSEIDTHPESLKTSFRRYI
jgi:hypothetical protein